MFGFRPAETLLAFLFRLFCGVLFATQLSAASLAEQEIRNFPSAVWTVLNGSVVGSAFPIAPALIATNAHVVQGLQIGDSVTLFSSSSGKRKLNGVLIAVSPRIDLAIVEIDTPRSLGLSPTAPDIQIGSRVLAQGSSVRFGRTKVHRSDGVLVSGPRHIDVFGTGFIGRFEGITAGYSGGPVVDDRGRIVGMLSAVSLSPTASTTTHDAFLIAIDDLLSEANRMLKTLQSKRAGSG